MAASAAASVEADQEPGGECGVAEVRRDHGLVEAGAGLEQHVLALLDEVELEEALDEGPLDLLGVVPVEAVHGLERAEAGEARRITDAGRSAAPLLQRDAEAHGAPPLRPEHVRGDEVLGRPAGGELRGRA